MDQGSSVVYIRFRKRISHPRGLPILLGDIVQLLAEPDITPLLSEIVLHLPERQDGSHLLIDVLLVTEQIRLVVPGIQVELFGEPHTLVEIVSGPRKPKLLAAVLVWLLLFIGSGLAIMNFHADVSMPDVHKRIYELLTGKSSEHPYWLQIPYSIGIGAGMVLFFNHLFRKKFNDEPSPLEVEMFMYQENMNQYVITEEYSKLSRQKDVSQHVRRGG